jgi:hypothetical protein
MKDTFRDQTDLTKEKFMYVLVNIDIFRDYSDNNSFKDQCDYILFSFVFFVIDTLPFCFAICRL